MTAPIRLGGRNSSGARGFPSQQLLCLLHDRNEVRLSPGCLA